MAAAAWPFFLTAAQLPLAFAFPLGVIAALGDDAGCSPAKCQMFRRDPNDPPRELAPPNFDPFSPRNLPSATLSEVSWNKTLAAYFVVIQLSIKIVTFVELIGSKNRS